MSKSAYSGYKAYVVLAGLIASAGAAYKYAVPSKQFVPPKSSSSAYSQGSDLHACLKNPSAPECAPSNRSYGMAPTDTKAKEGLHLPAFAESGQQKPCEVFPATAELSAESDLFATRIGRLQKGYHDRSSATNPHAACANSETGVMASKSIPALGFPHNTCRNDHQNELKELQARKSEYYKRYLALSREPACAGLLASAENLALGRSMAQAPLQPSFAEDRSASRLGAAVSDYAEQPEAASSSEGMR